MDAAASSDCSECCFIKWGEFAFDIMRTHSETTDDNSTGGGREVRVGLFHRIPGVV